MIISCSLVFVAITAGIIIANRNVTRVVLRNTYVPVDSLNCILSRLEYD
ncbi:MAG: hypothetical protein ACP6IU_13380 [Candidatus Asgardarchaeia archaeon]